MKSARQLVKTALLATAALIMVALAVASIFVLFEVLSPSELWDPSGAFIAGLYATLVLGAVPAVLFGAPGYWLLWRCRRARWLTVLPLGAALGALVAVLEPALLPWGFPVASSRRPSRMSRRHAGWATPAPGASCHEKTPTGKPVGVLEAAPAEAWRAAVSQRSFVSSAALLMSIL